MNKFLLGVVLFLASSCSIIPIKNHALKNDFKKVTIHANIDSPSSNLLKGSKVKTKITILKDSITLSFRPVLGIEMGKINIKDNVIWWSQSFKNKIDTIIGSKSHSPRFKVKHIQNKMIQRKLKKDTMVYKNNSIKLLFTDYIFSNNIYLPEKILFLNNAVDADKGAHVVNFKYQSVSLDKSIKK